MLTVVESGWWRLDGGRGERGKSVSKGNEWQESMVEQQERETSSVSEDKVSNQQERAT